MRPALDVLKHPQLMANPRDMAEACAKVKTPIRMMPPNRAPLTKRPEIRHSPNKSSIQGKTMATSIPSLAPTSSYSWSFRLFRGWIER